jgi:hypothetical protein
MSPDVADLYARYIKPLPSESRLQLLAAIASELAYPDDPTESRERSLLDLEGLGAEIWQGIDAQAYIDGLRAEWDQRP